MLRFTAVLAVALAACGGASAPGGELDAVTLALEPELRIGSVDDDADVLTWFGELVVAPDGRIFTAHRMESLIRVHAADGRLIRTIGRKGAGPGEFDNIGTMGLLGDTLWVLDFGTYRFNFFSLDGEFLHSRRIPIQLGRGGPDDPPRPRGLLSDGSIVASPPAWSQEVAAGRLTHSVLLRMAEDGSTSDTIVRYSLENGTWAITDPDDPRGFGSYQSQPFNDTELVQLYEAAVVRVIRAVSGSAPARFRIVKHTLDGDTVFAQEYGYTPVPIAAALVDSLVRDIGKSMERARQHFPSAPTPARAEELARASLYTPAHHPPVSELVIGRDGTLWLRREDTGTGRVNWSLVSVEGAPLGTLEAPAALRIMAADRTTAWGLELDELDVPYIVRYRVVPSTQ